MDKFTKYVLIALTVALLVMTVSAYVGFMIGGNAATDDIVNDLGGGGTTYSPFTVEALGEYGEYIGFSVVGAVGGFIVGYIMPSLFNIKTASGRAD